MKTIFKDFSHKSHSPSWLESKALVARNTATLFCLGWAATWSPEWLYPTSTAWILAFFCGFGLALAYMVSVHLSGRITPLMPLVVCTALVSLTMLLDLWRSPPFNFFELCGSPTLDGIVANVLHHVRMHWLWFPYTTIGMLAWVFLHTHSLTSWKAFDYIRRPPQLKIHLICAQTSVRIAMSLLMLSTMVLAMNVLDSLVVAFPNYMGGGAMICSMISGMALYHLIFSLLPPKLRALC
ncbi:hypothetical protein GIV19_02105 [Pseudomonas syringae]|uniref:hypothetical protein n=1 Tax=Pseudomonas syringae TaxID=317 RepID=UPI001F2FA7CA|nr:hypothetical protein [Pseudomonas syringae]MCF5706078.1 hypothetical protein [Pseudomonas syringae]